MGLELESLAAATSKLKWACALHTLPLSGAHALAHLPSGSPQILRDLQGHVPPHHKQTLQSLVPNLCADKSLPTPLETPSHTALSLSLHTFRAADTVSAPMSPDIVTKHQTASLLTSLPHAHPPGVSLGLGNIPLPITHAHEYVQAQRHTHTHTRPSAQGSSPDGCLAMQKVWSALYDCPSASQAVNCRLCSKWKMKLLVKNRKSHARVGLKGPLSVSMRTSPYPADSRSH